MQWKQNTPMSWEFALLRTMIAQTMGGVKNANLQDYMLSNSLKEPEKEWHELTQKEKGERIEISMNAWDTAAGVKSR